MLNESGMEGQIERNMRKSYQTNTCAKRTKKTVNDILRVKKNTEKIKARQKKCIRKKYIKAPDEKKCHNMESPDEKNPNDFLCLPDILKPYSMRKDSTAS